MASQALASHNSIPPQRENLRPVSSQLQLEHSRHVENRPPTPLRKTGTVKFFNRQKNYGFIIPEHGGAEVFVHVDDLVNAGALHWEQQVEYELVIRRDGRPKAKDVRVIGGRK